MKLKSKAPKHEAEYITAEEAMHINMFYTIALLILY